MPLSPAVEIVAVTDIRPRSGATHVFHYYVTGSSGVDRPVTGSQRV